MYQAYIHAREYCCEYNDNPPSSSSLNGSDRHHDRPAQDFEKAVASGCGVMLYIVGLSK